MGNVTAYLLSGGCSFTVREGLWALLAFLAYQLGKVNAPTVQARAGTGFESPYAKSQLPQVL
jgi:hypothetical protein